MWSITVHALGLCAGRAVSPVVLSTTVSTSPGLLAGPREVASHLQAVVASLHLELIGPHIPDVQLSIDQSVVNHPFGRLGCVKPHAQRGVRTQRFVGFLEPCNILYVIAFGLEVVVFRDFVNDVLLVLR